MILPRMVFKEYPDRGLLMAALAQVIAEDLSAALGAALADHGRASLAVPGGNTPGPVFDILANADLDWSRVDIMLTDERWVPENHPRSNTSLLRARLLVGKAARARLLPLYAGTEQPEESLAALSDGLRVALPLSVVLLGMGEDMHIASLFPGADKLADALANNAPPLLAMRAPGAPEPRVSLSAPVLNGAGSKHLLITGQSKRAALAQAENLTPLEAPVRAVIPGLTVHWAA